MLDHHGIDHQGSTRDVIAGSSGPRLNHFDHDPFGDGESLPRVALARGLAACQ